MNYSLVFNSIGTLRPTQTFLSAHYSPGSPLLVAVNAAINLYMMDRIISPASAGRACRLKQQYFYVEKNATTQIIIRIIAV